MGRRDSYREGLRQVAPYMGLGWVLAASVGLGTVGGFYADRHFGTSPWLTLIGLGVGMVAGFVSVLQGLLGADRSRPRHRGGNGDPR